MIFTLRNWPWLLLPLLVCCQRLPAKGQTPTGSLLATPTTISTQGLAPTATLNRNTADETSPESNKAGIHLLLDDGRNTWPVALWRQHLEYARLLVGEWGYVTELVRLDDLDTLKWQYLFDLCSELHLTPILRLATTFDRTHGMWLAPPMDETGSYREIAMTYAAFVDALRWPTMSNFVVVGNEPNHGEEWGGRANPAEYARFLMETSTALRQINAGVRVINAPLDPFAPNSNGQALENGMTYLDSETFMDQMISSEPDVFRSIDIWGSHAYPLGPWTEGPWVQNFRVDLMNGAVNDRHSEPPPGVFNRGINGYKWELHKLNEYGVTDLSVIVLETGWRHKESTDPAALDSHAAGLSAQIAAEYLDLAMYGNAGRFPQWPDTGWLPWTHDPSVIAVTPFVLDGNPGEWGHSNWLQLRSDGSVAGNYAMFDFWGR